MEIYGRQEHQYVLPQLKGIIPLEFHPHQEEIINASRAWMKSYPAFADWARTSWAPGDGQAPDHWLAQGFDVYALMVVPHVPSQAARAIADFFQWFTLFDDQLTLGKQFLAADRATVQSAIKRLIDVGHGEKLSALDPDNDLIFEEIFRSSWESMTAVATPAAMERLAGAMQRMMESWMVEEEARAVEKVFNFDSYLQLRSISIASDEMYRCCEIALGIDLSDTYARYPLELSRLEHLINLQCLYINDVYSFRKECVFSVRDRRANGPNWDMLNGIAVLICHEGASLQEAVDKLLVLAQDTERDFVRLRDAFLADHPDLPPEVVSYVHEIGMDFAANRYYHPRSPRYHGSGHDWSEVHGLITLSPERTIFAPATSPP